MRKDFLVVIFLCLCVYSKAQPDSLPTSRTHFSSLQLTIGFNHPKSKYGGTGKPFDNSFAVAAYEQVNLDIQYGREFYKDWGFVVEAAFIRNEFDYMAFDKAYEKTYGDTIGAGSFLYQHLGLYAGPAYFLKAGNFLFTLSVSAGGLYTFYPKGEDNKVGLYVTKTAKYRGGSMSVGGSTRPTGMAKFDARYSAGYDTYVTFSAAYTQSSYKMHITEKGPNHGDPEHPYLSKILPISNFAYTFGVCVLF